MDLLKFSVRKLVGGIPLILGVSFISFLLMVYFGPDISGYFLGKNPTAEQIASVRAQLGYDKPFLVRYVDYLKELVTLDFGESLSSGEVVSSKLGKAIPVTLALMAPGFVLGNLLGLGLALVAAYYRGRWLDKLIMGASVVGMSISFLIVVIFFQLVFCSSQGLNWFPSRGWEVYSFASYLYYVTVPTLAVVFVALGYNTRFYRAILVEELGRDHVRTARAYGTGPAKLLYRNVLKNSLIPIVTRVMFSIPLVVVSGSLIIESYFGIPGVGKITYDAITLGDQPVLKAVVGMTAVLFVITLLLTDILYRVVDPRVELS
ncbi:MAG: ABC transporter permease [Gammaproteobacteria bacterium]